MARPESVDPSLLPTEEQRAIVLESMRLGLFYVPACARAGITKQKAQYWYEQGAKEQDTPLARWRTDVDVERANYALIMTASARKDPKAAAHAQWWLERAYPKEYVPPKVSAELTGAGDGPIATTVVHLPTSPRRVA